MMRKPFRDFAVRFAGGCDWQSLVAGMVCSVAVAGLTLSVLLGNTVARETPAQLLGCLAYVWTPLGISNRLFAVGVSVALAALTMLAMSAALSFQAEDRRHRTAGFVTIAFAPVFLQLASGNMNVNSGVDLSWVGFSLALSLAVVVLQFRRSRAVSGAEYCLLFESFFVPCGFLIALRLAVFSIDPGSYAVLVSWCRLHLAWAPYGSMLIAVAILTWAGRGSVALQKATPLVLQLLTLPLFAALMPAIMDRAGTLTVLHAPGRIFWFVVLPVSALALADIIVRHCRHGLFGRALSPFPLLAILALHHYRQFSVMGLSNLYEYGDRISAYAAIRGGNLMCFRDVTPCYGLWDWLQLRLTEFFAGGALTMADTLGESLLAFLVLAFSFCVFFHLLPVGIAFFLSYFLGGWVAALMASVIMVWLHPAALRHRALWCALWSVSACFLFFFRVPQGAMMVASFMPLFLWQFVQCLRLERARFVKLLGFLAILGILMLVWPFAPYFYGMVRIVLETGSINSAWAASAWSVGTGGVPALLSSNAVILLPACVLAAAALVLRRCRFELDGVGGTVAFGLVTVAFAYVFGSLSYSFSRFDDLYSRQYQSFCSLLPLILCPAVWVVQRRRVEGTILTVLAFAPLASVCLVKGIPPPASPCRQMALPPTMLDVRTMVDGRDFGLSSLGRGYAPQGIADELRAEGELKQVLDKVLDRDETFLNLSLYGGLYFAFGRTLPWRHTNYYTVTGDATQKFMLKQLEGKKIGAAVFGRDVYDFSYPMLRTRHLFRHAVTNALPYKVNDRYFVMLSEDRFVRLGKSAPTLKESLRIWDEFYNDANNLYRSANLIYAPSVWGRAVEAVVGGKGVQRRRFDVLSTGAKEAKVAVDAPLAGSVWGIAVVDSRTECWAGCRWTNEFGVSGDIFFKLMPGANVIPLDAYPSWLLARRNTDLEFFSQDNPLNLKDVSFFASRP